MNFKPLFRFLRQTPGITGLAMAALSLAIMEAVFAPVQAHIIRQLIDGLLAGDQQSLLNNSLTIGLLIVAIALIAWARSWVLGWLSERGSAHLRDQAVQSLLEMEVPRLDAIHSGDHLSRLTNDAAVVRHYLYFELFWLISLPLAAVLGLAYLLYIDWIMTLVTLALIPLFVLLSTRAAAPVGKISGRLQEKLAEVNNLTQDALGGAEVVKAFNLQEAMEARCEESLAGVVRASLDLARQQVKVRCASVLAAITPFLIPVGIGGWFAIIGRITTGSLLGFLNLINNVTAPIERLPRAMAGHQKAMAALDRIFQLIDEPRERTSGEEFGNGQEVILSARDLVFGYDNGPVLQGLSFELRRGETVALVGPSGAGKSTVFKLLTGFYRPSQGNINLYNRPLEEWNLSALRRQMAVVSQDTFLFPGTIAENIALGKPGASREEIIAAAKKANAHQFIQELPQGYDHVLAERGANLSGGQRQRLAIARAILLDAPILLLDEATSALDTESERLVQDALDNMAQERTTLVIAHRLSTIRNAQRILVLDQGRIVESGRHQDLLEQGGLYRQLYLRQFNTAAEKGGVA
ncbi:MAG: ABC transporter ATP-binding protein [Bacillota bacterium]|jgi:ABC-type multidrug transport system fused ATPase/permease subunit